jgi:hypothetical protein
MKKLFKFLVRALLFYWGFSFLIGMFRFFNQQPDQSYLESSQLDSTNFDYYHQRIWKTYNGNNFSLSFTSSLDETVSSGERRNEFPYPAYQQNRYEAYWGKVYEHLTLEQSTVINDIRDSLSSIMIHDGLDTYQAADLIVTFIQDIPYTLIKSDECNEEDPDRCLGNMKYGILSPTEFMYELHGDCDTRAVFLFKLLDYFGYDPIIVVSKEYGHAMIAINIPTSGEYIEYRGIRYYFWETTAKGWQSGMLPPSYPEVDYWHVALSTESLNYEL